MGWKGVATLALAAALGLPGSARGADPGRWTVTGTTTLPIVYYQGVTVDPAHNFYFDGVYVGLYRTDPGLAETGRTDDVIPQDVRLSEGCNHIGDIAWDRQEGGRILLPLECYVPSGPNGGNPCLHGSIGVAGSPLVWLLRRSRATVLVRRGFAAAVLCPTAAPRGWRSSAGASCSRARPSARRAPALARRVRSSA
jgi:hypothetical protein